MADGDTAEVELEGIRYGNMVFSGSSAPALRQHPINKYLIAHFKSKGDSVSWGIAESIERYEEDTKKFVVWSADIAAFHDQETERELTQEVENRFKAVLSVEALLTADPPLGKTGHETLSAAHFVWQWMCPENPDVYASSILTKYALSSFTLTKTHAHPAEVYSQTR